MLSDLYRGHPETPRRGRHALDEDELFTPIFHALTRDDLPVVPPEPPAEEVDRFRRDPLTAPIPVPVLTDAWLPDLPRSEPPRGRRAGMAIVARRRLSDAGAHALTDTGRHHRHREPVRIAGW